MKKAIFAALALVAAAINNGYSQSILLVSDAEYNTLLKETKEAKPRVKTTVPDENGFRGFHIGVGGSFLSSDIFGGHLNVGYQFGRSGGGYVYLQGELFTDRSACFAGFEQHLGRFHAESWFIPFVGVQAGFLGQDRTSGKKVQNGEQELYSGSVTVHNGFSAGAYLGFKLKPFNDPRYYFKVAVGYRLTPDWGQRLKVDNYYSDGTPMGEYTPDIPKKFGIWNVSAGFYVSMFKPR